MLLQNEKKPREETKETAKLKMLQSLLFTNGSLF